MNWIQEKKLRSHQENDNSYSPARRYLEERMLASTRGNADPEDEDAKQNMGETENINETLEAIDQSIQDLTEIAQFKLY